MRLAPTIRCTLTEDKKSKLETELQQQNEQKLYLGNLKEGAKTGRCGKTWPLEDKDDDVIIVGKLKFYFLLTINHNIISNIIVKLNIIFCYAFFCLTQPNQVVIEILVIVYKSSILLYHIFYN